MEDISRDLAKEIVDIAGHVTIRRKIKSSFFLIDDLGGIKPASWMKGLIWFCVLTTIISIAAAFLFYSLYTENRAEKTKFAGKLVRAEKKINSLTNEKELLMARIVISGKTLPHGLTDRGVKGLDKSLAAVKANMVKNKKSGLVSSDNRIIPGLKENQTGLKHTAYKQIPYKTKQGSIQTKVDFAEEKIKTEKILKSGSLKQDNNSESKYNKNMKYQKIGMEDFKLFKDTETGDLLVRFNIRNISSNPGNISGRIFVILEPDSNPSDWLVVPSVAIKDGKPVNFKRGQYFSIAHFKSVNFRIKNKSASDSFKKAFVFIYDKDKLIYMKKINIVKEHGR